MSYADGFKCFNLKYIVSSIDTAGSIYENNDPTSGKILNSNNTFGYTDDKYGVKRCLEDFCAPLFTQNANDEGWELDTDLCPNNEAILLKPNNRVHVLFFRHTTGARLMIGLSYFGMASMNSQPSVDPPIYNSSSGRYYDIGFLPNKTSYPITSLPSSSASTYMPFGSGLFISMIPPANSGDVQETFHPDTSILDAAFYASTQTPVMYQKLNVYTYPSNINNSSMFGASFIKQGTIDNNTSHANSYTAAKNNGVIVGKSINLSLLVCQEVVGFTGNYNNTIQFGSVLCGRLLSDCRNQEDTLSTAEYATTCTSCGTSSNSGYYFTWNQSYQQCQICWCCNTTGSKWVNMYLNYNTNGYVTNSTNYEYAYSGYVIGYCDSAPVSLNGQMKAKLRSDLFRFTTTDTNKTFGQTYNDNNWVYYGRQVYSSSQLPSTGTLSNPLLLKWNGTFNGTTTLC